MGTGSEGVAEGAVPCRLPGGRAAGLTTRRAGLCANMTVLDWLKNRNMTLRVGPGRKMGREGRRQSPGVHAARTKCRRTGKRTAKETPTLLKVLSFHEPGHLTIWCCPIPTQPPLQDIRIIPLTWKRGEGGGGGEEEEEGTEEEGEEEEEEKGEG